MSGRYLPLSGPLQQPIQRPGGDDPLGGYPVRGRALGTVLQEIQLARRMGVAVDAEQTAGIEGQPDQLVRRILPFGAGIDFDGHIILGARREHARGVELGLRAGSPRPLQQPAGAVAEDVRVRIIDGAQHPLGHGAPVGAELRVDARHHDVQPVQHLRGLVQGAVLQDVHLDPGQEAEVPAVRR